MRTRYSSDLTDAQWQAIEPLFRDQYFRKHDARSMLNALFYVNKTGCQWRMLPQGEAGFPPSPTVYYHFRKWMRTGLLERINDILRRIVRVKNKRAASPTVAIIDSQSVKTSHVGGPRSFDGGKKVNGRKRHIVVDTLGLLLAVLVHPAGLSDSAQAPHLLKRLVGKVPALRVIFADEGYAGVPFSLVARCFGWVWQLVHKAEGQRGFAVLPKRWIVERTFAWFGGYRRLSKDYEYLPAVSEAMVQLSAIRMMIRRIA